MMVVVINLLLALFCFYLAWKVWQFRRAIANAADALLIAEQNTHNVLHGAPDAILKGQIGTSQLRQRYQQLEPQYQKARQALALLSIGQTIWRQRVRFLSTSPQRTLRSPQSKSRR
jgi:hypothetical protein